jgi:thiol:disulfide interchange protein DsbD
MKPVAILALAAAMVCARADGIKWVNDFSAGQKLAKKERRLIVVDFYADWCKECKLMEQRTYVNAKVQAAMKKFVAIKVNTDLPKNRPTVAWYAIDPLPTILVLDADGNVLRTLTGFVPPAEFAAKISATRK